MSVFAILSVLAGKRAEVTGLTDMMLSTATRRWAPLAAQTTVTADGCALLLTVTGVISALITPSVMDGTDIDVRSLSVRPARPRCRRLESAVQRPVVDAL